MEMHHFTDKGFAKQVDSQEQYNNRILLIEEFIKVCNLTIEDLCIHINIDHSTFYRYRHYNSHFTLDKYLIACNFFKQYMKKNKIPYTEELRRLIKAIELFPDEVINEQEN